MNTTTTEMHRQLVALTTERDHWKANHDNRVNAAKILMDRTDMPLERVGAYKHYVAALEESQNLRERAESAEAELAKLMEQEPVAYVKYKQTGGNVGLSWVAIPTGAFYPNEGDPLYAATIPALAVLAPPTPFIPDDDTRRNDEAFAAQQAATAPSVPEGCAIVSRTLTPGAWKRLCNADIWPVTPKSFQRMLDVLMEVALLQSAVVKDSLTAQADCRACVNRGRVNGLSQESYCDSCIYQGRDWRQNHFVDARKMVDTVSRRCEACAILPCSCK